MPGENGYPCNHCAELGIGCMRRKCTDTRKPVAECNGGLCNYVHDTDTVGGIMTAAEMKKMKAQEAEEMAMEVEK
jgi:hypothetical protein